MGSLCLGRGKYTSAAVSRNKPSGATLVRASTAELFVVARRRLGYSLKDELNNQPDGPLGGSMDCPICHETMRIVEKVQGQYLLWFCLQCHLHRMEEWPT